MNRIKNDLKAEKKKGTSLVIQWLGLGASTVGGVGLIPGWETKIPEN